MTLKCLNHRLAHGTPRKRPTPLTATRQQAHNKRKATSSLCFFAEMIANLEVTFSTILQKKHNPHIHNRSNTE